MIPERISIDKAEQFGLISKRCDIDELEQVTLDFCHNLVEKPQAVLIPIKALLNKFLLSNMAYFFEKEAEAVDLSLEGDPTKFDEFIAKLWNTNL